MAKKRSPVDLPLPVIRAQKSAAFTEEKRDEIADRRDAALWEMAQRIGGPQAIRELKPKLDKQANIEHGVSFDVLVKEIGLTAAVSKLGFGAQFIEAAKRAGLLGAIARLGCGPGAKVVYRAKSNSYVLRPLNGGGADTTLLEQAIQSETRRRTTEVNKAIRTFRTRLAQKEISKAGVAARTAAADLVKDMVIALYMEGKRRSVIATRAGITVQRVGQIIKAEKKMKMT